MNAEGIVNFEAATLDDLMHDVFAYILEHGQVNNASKGKNIEILGCELRLSNPIARVSRTESRGLIFSCLGELFWYLSGSNEGSHIEKYIPKYGTFIEADGLVHGGYGKRLFNMHEKYNQIERVIEQLKNATTTRRAVIQLFDSSDLSKDYKDIPCTLNLQFVVRNRKLHMFTTMRSNDAYIGLPHDIFVFTMLQEMISRELQCELGIYHHYVTSLHIYNANINSAKRFIDEGFQQTDSIMSDMPPGGFFSIRNKLLDYEIKIRNDIELNIDELDLCDYWKDILRLLQFYIKKESHNISGLRHASEVRRKITNKKYQQLINSRERIKNKIVIKI